jgi:hypothetical protein
MQRQDSPTKEGAPVTGTPSGSKEEGSIATKREYNRWLVTQNNFASAEEVRMQRKAAEEQLQERERKHKAQGLSRQQAATAQMKQASEALEAHREANLSLGRAVSNEISGWRMGAQATKQAWSAYGKEMRDRVKAANGAGAAVAETLAKKKAQAGMTRKEDEEVAKKVEELKEQWKKQASEQAQVVRTETSHTVTDDAKRYFYEARLKSAKDVKELSAKCEKDRAAEKSNFQATQNVRRKKVKSARDQAGKSRVALKTQRAEEASALREKKTELSKERIARKKLDEDKKIASRNAVLASIAYDPNDPNAKEGLPSPSFSISPTGAR